jgi:hypothetical protein
VPVLVTRSAYFADRDVGPAIAVGPGLHERAGWLPAPAAGPGRVGLDDLGYWLERAQALPRPA